VQKRSLDFVPLPSWVQCRALSSAGIFLISIVYSSRRAVRPSGRLPGRMPSYEIPSSSDDLAFSDLLCIHAWVFLWFRRTIV